MIITYAQVDNITEVTDIEKLSIEFLIPQQGIDHVDLLNAIQEHYPEPTSQNRARKIVNTICGLSLPTVEDEATRLNSYRVVYQAQSHSFQTYVEARAKADVLEAESRQEATYHPILQKEIADPEGTRLVPLDTPTDLQVIKYLLFNKLTGQYTAFVDYDEAVTANTAAIQEAIAYYVRPISVSQECVALNGHHFWVEVTG